MMNFNPKIKKAPEKIINPEGYEVYGGNKSQELFLLASNLKPKKLFYEDDAVKSFIKFLEKLPKSEQAFAVALANYLDSIGIKLAPLIILNTLGKESVKHLTHIFDRPDKIANYIGLSGGFRKLKTCEKKGLKIALENLKPHTLAKMQLKGRTIKTKDLIKMLRPKPSTEELAKTYKEIIENTCKIETLLTIKSSKTVDEAKAFYENNIENMPINMLIRNLRMYKTTTNPIETRTKILAKLEKIATTNKVLNPFDFVTVAVEEPTLELEMNSLLNNFCKNVELKLEGTTAVLFDVSGSMGGPGISDGFKNLVMINKILKPENLHFFTTQCYERDPFILEYLNRGSIDKAKDYLDKVFARLSGGTSLLDSVKLMCTKYDNIIIISDEVSWADDYTIDAYRKVAKDKKLICINPVKYAGTVFKDKFLALASIDAKIMLYLQLLVDFDGFKNWIIQNYGLKKE